MSSRDDIREFLTTRRARLTPEQIGLPDFGGRRRVPGLRREEVALVAGMSVEYYVRLERGQVTGVSESVLDNVARALQLDDAERGHLYDLVRGAGGSDGGSRARRRPRPREPQVRASLKLILDAMDTVPAFVQNGRLDILASNHLGQAVFSELYVRPRRPPTSAASSSWTRAPKPSTATGPTPPTRASPSCAPKPDAHPTTATSPTSSENWPPAARSSAPSGPPTTSASTAPASNRSTTPRSETST